MTYLFQVMINPKKKVPLNLTDNVSRNY